MQLRHLKTLHLPSELVDGRFQRVTALAWSPNNYRLAVATIDRFITLYDEDGNQRDRFPTKPAEKDGSKNYVVRGLEFSPDSTKLAVAQSDNIVFVYKLGKTWADKKTICNKYPLTSPVTALCWPLQRPNDIIIGCADGKVKIGTPANKSETRMNTESIICAIAPSPDGGAFVVSTVDGNIFRYQFPAQEGRTGAQSTVSNVGFSPYALGWGGSGNHIVAAGNSPTVKILDLQGSIVQQFNYSSDDSVKEFTCLAFNPSGQTFVLGNFNRFFVYAFNQGKNYWEESSVSVVENLYSVTAARWKSDGSRLITGSLCGAVDAYDACLRRMIYKNEYEFTYTSLSSVIVKKLSTGQKMAVKSRYGLEIKNIKIYEDRYLVARTAETLMLGDLARILLSEIAWSYPTAKRGAPQEYKEKFFFENENVALVYNQGELSIVEYGQNEVLGSCRTELLNHHLVSVRINESKRDAAPVKKMAYLLDAQAIRVMNIGSHGRSVNDFTYNHDAKIDWLELNQSGSKLLFRDKRRALHLVDLDSQHRQTLINFCNYVQWVPDSDVIVAQSRRSLLVWYSIDHVNDVTTIPINGDIVQIERGGGKTEVTVDEGMHQATYQLDEALIAFGSAIEAHDFKRAVATLEAGQLAAGNNATALKGNEAMWSQLYKLALDEEDFLIAERCASALGDVARTKFLNKINQLIAQQHGDRHHYMVKAHIFMLHKQFKRAEAVFLSQGQIEDAIQMYRQLHKWEEALNVAESKNHPMVPQLRDEYFNYLVNTKQEEIAGELKERNGEYNEALQLYLKGGFPAHAARIVVNQGMTGDRALCDKIGAQLVNSKAFDRAGEFFEQLGQSNKAMESYVKGNVFHRAVELAKREFPSQIVKLHDMWGDYLVTQKQMDAACNHYIEAGSSIKAINAAIEAGQFNKAHEIADGMDEKQAKPYYEKLAVHFASVRRYNEAEKYFIACGQPKRAVEMYTTAGLWDRANAIASQFMTEAQVALLYNSQAQKLEATGKLKEAERLYLQMNDPDLAIAMYRKARQFDDLIRLTNAYRKDLLEETHMQIAQQYQTDGNLKQAEQHFIKAKAWKSAVQMYEQQEMWEDVLRVAKSHGGQDAYRQFAYKFAMSVGGEAGIKLLINQGLGGLAVDYAMERGQFQDAFEIAQKAAKDKIFEVHRQFGMALEDEGKYLPAEEEFIKARKPKEAIEMWLHCGEWDHAMRVAEQYDPPSIPLVYVAQGDLKAKEKQFSAAEHFYLLAKRPQNAIKMYQDNQKFDDAVRVARVHAPKLVNEIQNSRTNYVASSAPSDSLDQLSAAAKMALTNKQWNNAIDAFLKITKDHTSDHDSLEQHWNFAVKVALDHTPSRVSDVVRTVVERFVEIGRFESAASVLVQIDETRQAIDVLISGKKWDAAKQLADSPQLIKYVNEKHQSELLGKKKFGDLESVNPDAAIDAYAANGEWTRVFEMAAKQGPQVVQKFAALQAASLAKEGKFYQALQVFLTRGVAVVPNNFPLYKRIAHEIFVAAGDPEGKKGDHERDDESTGKNGEVYMQLREMLFKLVTELHEIDPKSKTTEEFERFLQIAHFCSLRLVCEKYTMKDQFARLSVSLLRYATELPVDKLFFDAGSACRDANLPNMAFVFYNRFVDLIDLMADPDAPDIDNLDFMQTDIPTPFDTPLPKQLYYTQHLCEEARDWILEKAMSKELDQTLPTRACEKCNKQTYAAALKCHSCSHVCQPCIVTGYPVLRAQKFSCKSCNMLANKDDWNKYVSKFKSCPWCGSQQLPSY